MTEKYEKVEDAIEVSHFHIDFSTVNVYHALEETFNKLPAYKTIEAVKTGKDLAKFVKRLNLMNMENVENQDLIQAII